MTKQFTASEVRGNASFRRKAEPELAEMLHAYADRLEEEEKAVPAAWYVPSIISFKNVARTSCPPEFQPELEGTVVWHASMIGDADPVTDKFGVMYYPIPLYTHPAPADAERLAEETVLRHGWAYSYSGTNLYADDGELQDNVEFPHIDFLRDRAKEIHQKIAIRGARKLTAHSTQAQPPAASVTDEMTERARSAFVQADDGSTGITDAIRAALLAAQKNPNG